MSTQQIFTVVGTVVGAYFGYPGLGAAAGSLVGALLTDPIQGPRLADLKANKVDYGSVIPWVEGHPRLAPVLVWQSEKREVETDQGEGCGGGATSYSYVSDCLWLLSENKCGKVRKAWYNSKLCYNVALDATDETIEASVETPKWSQLIQYEGNQDQQPDPTYEAALGDVPAYRGRSTMLTKDLELLGPEGVLPVLTTEVSGLPTDETNIGKTIKILENYAEADYRGSPPEGTNRGKLSLTAVMAQSIRTYITDGNIIDNPLPTGCDYGKPGRCNGDRTISVFGFNASGNCRIGYGGDGIQTNVIVVDEIYGYLGNSEIRASTYKGDIAFGSSVPYTGVADHSILGQENTEAQGYKGYVYIYTLLGVFIAKILVKDDIPTVDAGIALSSTRVYVCGSGQVAAYDRNNEYNLADVFALPPGGGHNAFISSVGVLHCATAEEKVFVYEDGAWNELADLSDYVEPPDGDPVDLGTATCDHVVTGASIFAINTHKVIADEIKQYTLWRYSGDDPNTHDLYRSSLNELATVYATVTPAIWNRFSHSDPFFYRETGIGSYLMDASIPYSGPPIAGAWGTVTDTVTVHFTGYRRYGYPGDFPSSGMLPAESTATFYAHLITFHPGDELPTFFSDIWRKRINVDLVDIYEPTLEDVTRRQCLRGGLEEADFDFTDLATRNVRAMAIAQVTSPDNILDMLTGAFFYNFKEAEQIVGEFLGKEVVATIPFEDLGADGGEPFEKTKTNDLELPSQKLITYMNVSDDYQNDTQESDRLISVGTSISSEEIPIGFEPTEAKRIADSKVLIPAVGNFTGSIALSRKYSRLQSGDAVRVFDEDGSSYRIRFTRCNYENGIYRFDWIIDDARAYTSAAVAAGGYTNSTVVNPVPATEFEFIDNRLVDDSQDGPNIFIAAKGVKNSWPGYVMSRGPDGTSFSKLYDSTKKATLGTCTSVLGTWVGPNYVDEINEVSVDVGDGVLLSVSYEDFLQSKANLAVVGNTVLQFQLAIMIGGPGKYKLSRLVYHSDPTLDDHQVGEKFVLLQPDRIDKIGMSLADFGLNKYYRAQTFGQPISRATVKEHAPSFTALIPLSVANLRALDRLDGSITVFWDRRSRLATNALRGIVPLGETSESYLIDIYDEDMDTLKGSYTSATEEFTWPVADKTAAYPGGGNAIIKVRQVGQLVGYAAEIMKEI